MLCDQHAMYSVDTFEVIKIQHGASGCTFEFYFSYVCLGDFSTHLNTFSICCHNKITLITRVPKNKCLFLGRFYDAE